jgi:hypothetical protein
MPPRAEENPSPTILVSAKGKQIAAEEAPPNATRLVICDTRNPVKPMRVYVHTIGEQRDGFMISAVFGTKNEILNGVLRNSV